MEQITLKLVGFTANNTLEKPYKTSKKTIDINKIKYVQCTGASFIVYYFRGRPSEFRCTGLFKEYLQWIKDNPRDYEDILKEKHYQGAYLLDDDELVNFLKTEFEFIDENYENIFVRKK